MSQLPVYGYVHTRNPTAEPTKLITPLLAAGLTPEQITIEYAKESEHDKLGQLLKKPARILIVSEDKLHIPASLLDIIRSLYGSIGGSIEPVAQEAPMKQGWKWSTPEIHRLLDKTTAGETIEQIATELRRSTKGVLTRMRLHLMAYRVNHLGIENPTIPPLSNVYADYYDLLTTEGSDFRSWVESNATRGFNNDGTAVGEREGKPWEYDEYLTLARKLYAGAQLPQIAQILKRSLPAVKSRLHYLLPAEQEGPARWGSVEIEKLRAYVRATGYDPKNILRSHGIADPKEKS